MAAFLSRSFNFTEIIAHNLGDARKAKEKLGWEPKVKFKELVKIMVDADIERYGKQK